MKSAGAPRPGTLRAAFWVLGTTLAILQAASARFALSSDDAVAYLDLGDAAWSRLDPGALVNGYWSPLYPALQGAALHALRPTSYWETPLANAVNLLVFLLAMASFEWLLTEALRTRRATAGADAPRSGSDAPWRLAGYALFLWSSLRWITVTSDTPDMLVAALVFAAAASIVRLERTPLGPLAWAGFGALVGLACLAKTAMFPLAAVLLATGLGARAVRARRLSWSMLAAPVVTAGIALPFVVALSHAKGRPTFGDAGKLNYAWLVNPGDYRVADKHWQGRPRAFGRPLHPTRPIADDPPSFEFATPIGGTYPPWTDPSYWLEGLRLRFSLARQIRASTANLEFYLRAFLGALAIAVVAVGALADGAADAVRRIARGWPLWLPGLAGLGLYLVGTNLGRVTFPEQPSMRLAAPFAVLLCTGALLHSPGPPTRSTRRLLAAAGVAFAAVVFLRLALAAAQDGAAALEAEHTDWRAARALHALGVAPGDPVAIANTAFFHASWARVARVRVVAQTLVGNRLWHRGAAARGRFYAALAHTGARALVLASDVEPPEPGWHRLDHTGYWALLLAPAGERS